VFAYAILIATHPLYRSVITRLEIGDKQCLKTQKPVMA
jgi:hypothetical protein